MRTIAVVTVARSDYGIYTSILREIQAASNLRLQLIAAGMHLSPEFGMTVGLIEADGFEVSDRVEMLLSSDTALGTAKSIGLGVIGFAEVFARRKPDMIVVLGDRFEMHAAALAALPLGIPLAHIHGGEVTEGAIDEALRHGITKIAHLHFASTRLYADRIVRMGEEPWRVVVSGAPALDNLESFQAIPPGDLATRFGAPFDRNPILVTYHPVTRELDRTPAQIEALFQALAELSDPVIFTAPNADPAGRFLASRIQAFVAEHRHAHAVDNLGSQAYFSAMRTAKAMVGNSSSGIIEAPSFELPVVNVGARQAGRLRGTNVVDVGDDTDPRAIAAGIARALDPAFRNAIRGAANPYRHGNAARTIVEKLAAIPLDAALLNKRFHDA